MARSKRYYFGKSALGRGKTGIVVEDEVTPFAMIAWKNFPTAYRRTIRHVTFETYERTKRWIKTDEHGNKLSDDQANRTIDKYKNEFSGQKLNRKRHAGDTTTKGRSIFGAVKWNLSDTGFSGLVGFASSSARGEKGNRFQAGSRRVVDMKMKEFFLALAMKAKGKGSKKDFARLMTYANLPIGHVIRNPARPIFTPVYERMRPHYQRMIENRLRVHLDLMSEMAYQAILYDAVGTNDMIRDAKRGSDKFNERVKRQEARMNSRRGMVS